MPLPDGSQVTVECGLPGEQGARSWQVEVDNCDFQEAVKLPEGAPTRELFFGRLIMATYLQAILSRTPPGDDTPFFVVRHWPDGTEEPLTSMECQRIREALTRNSRPPERRRTD